jgi:hypothetical protein
VKEDMMRRCETFAVIAFALLAPVVAQAQGEERNQTLAFYGLAPFIDGDLTFGESGQGDIDVDAGDVFDSLELAATLRYRAQNEGWAFVLDGQFLGLGDTKRGDAVTVDLDLDQLIVQADAAYRFSETAEVLFGVRYLDFETELERREPAGTMRRAADESFTDAVVGLRTWRRLGEKMRLQAQGDVGAGDMDFSWHGMLNLGYQASDAISLWLGYRALGLEFDETEGPAGVEADMVMHGPTVGMALHF